LIAATLDSSISTLESLFASNVALALVSAGAPDSFLEILVLLRLPDIALVDEDWTLVD
jgi:hypothetical protein